jgi:hypothetical protein
MPEDNAPATPPSINAAPRPKFPSQDAPFIWQSKRILERINDSPHVTNHAHAKLVYVALTWIASDNGGASTFQTSKGLIAKKCDLSRRSVEYALAELIQSGVIGVERCFNPKKGQHDLNTYTLRIGCVGVTRSVRRGSRTKTAHSGACMSNSPQEEREEREGGSDRRSSLLGSSSSAPTAGAGGREEPSGSSEPLSFIDPKGFLQ